MGRIVFDEGNGYGFISNNGVKYELLEGEAIGVNATSDIIFIMLDIDGLPDVIKLFDDDLYKVVDYWMGAFMFDDIEKYRDELTRAFDYCVNNFEKKNPKIIEYYKEV